MLRKKELTGAVSLPAHPPPPERGRGEGQACPERDTQRSESSGQRGRTHQKQGKLECTVNEGGEQLLMTGARGSKRAWGS